ncbi:MAG: hypothetical protein K2X34_02875, partial [Hyphomonadaceae bacterium]|nr:hypothetical protein [Hyphomonadaceae bacterium]MBY0565654.1 hypothetical protein [Hyphomonadaceae bacterium]
IGHRWLDFIEKLITNIVLIRAAKRVRPILRRHFGPQRQLYPKRRAILGLRLRRALRGRDLRARIAALSQDIGALVDRVIHRLPRGLTRLRGTRARATTGARAQTAARVCSPSLTGARRRAADTS